MKQSRLLVALVAVARPRLRGKKKVEAPPPPPPRTTAPATPPPAPPPSQPREVAPVEDDYRRIRGMDIDVDQHLGLLEEVHSSTTTADIRDADRASLGKSADSLKKYDYLMVTVDGIATSAARSSTTSPSAATREGRVRILPGVARGSGGPGSRPSPTARRSRCSRVERRVCWGRNRRAHFTVTGKAARLSGAARTQWHGARHALRFDLTGERPPSNANVRVVSRRDPSVTAYERSTPAEPAGLSLKGLTGRIASTTSSSRSARARWVSVPCHGHHPGTRDRAQGDGPRGSRTIRSC